MGCTVVDILEGRSTLCKNIAKNLNSFIFFSMLVKRRFDGDFLHKFSNSISFMKNSNGVLNNISSEVSSCDLVFNNKKILLDASNDLSISKEFYSLNKTTNKDNLTLFNIIE